MALRADQPPLPINRAVECLVISNAEQSPRKRCPPAFLFFFLRPPVFRAFVLGEEGGRLPLGRFVSFCVPPHPLGGGVFALFMPPHHSSGHRPKPRTRECKFFVFHTLPPHRKREQGLFTGGTTKPLFFIDFSGDSFSCLCSGQTARRARLSACHQAIHALY